MAPITKIALSLLALMRLSTGDSPPSLPTITSVSYSGNACPQGSNSVTETGDWGSLGFSFSNFSASSPGTTSNRNCQVHLEASGASAGWQVSLSDIAVHGHTVLQPGAHANYWTTSFWSESPANTVSHKPHNTQ